MNPNLSRRHHYIPKMLLKNFCVNGSLWVGNRANNKIYRCTLNKAFVKKDLYMKYSIDGQKSSDEKKCLKDMAMSDEYEKALSQIESDAAPVIRRIIEQARSNQFPQLNLEDRTHWKQFMLAMARRTPESRARVMPESFNDTFYKATIMVAEKESVFGLPKKSVFYSDPSILKLKNMVKSNNVGMFAAGNHPFGQEEVDRFCRETGLYVVAISNPNRSFVIGSHGLAIVKSKQKNDPAQGSWLPIAHDIAVSATSFPDKELFRQLGPDSDQIIKRINRATAAYSQIFAGRSKALIHSLM